MLGSAQVLMMYHGVTYLFTGDYKLQDDDTCEPLETVQADVLITESTFADPQIIHPDPIAEISKLIDTPHHIMIGTYALGKAQRLTALLNKYCPDRRVWVHPGILPLHRLYAPLGITHPRYEPYDNTMLKTSCGPYTSLLPPLHLTHYSREPRFIWKV